MSFALCKVGSSVPALKSFGYLSCKLASHCSCLECPGAIFCCSRQKPPELHIGIYFATGNLRHPDTPAATSDLCSARAHDIQQHLTARFTLVTGSCGFDHGNNQDHSDLLYLFLFVVFDGIIIESATRSFSSRRSNADESAGYLTWEYARHGKGPR